MAEKSSQTDTPQRIDILAYCAQSVRKIFVRGGQKCPRGGTKNVGDGGGTGLDGGDNPILDSPADHSTQVFPPLLVCSVVVMVMLIIS